MILGKYREVYGFSDIKYLPSERLEVVELGGGATMEQLASCAQIPERELVCNKPRPAAEHHTTRGLPIAGTSNCPRSVCLLHC